MSSHASPLLEVNSLTVEFSRGRRRPPLRAADDVSFTLAKGETIGLVGESGSGKTTIGRAILGLTSVKSGTITFAGDDITHASYRDRRVLSSELQAVFQDPYSSLNPTLTIGQTLSEPLRVHSIARQEARERVREILQRVGLPPEATARYPAQFSGGQRQRIAIARALLLNPQLVICDEPTSALDLSVQAQVLNLLRELQSELCVSYLFISHDLAIVRLLSHRVVVLYHGQIMECGDSTEIYAKPTHPYTRALLAAAPVPDPDRQRERRAALRLTHATPNGSLSDRDSCPFSSRCPHVVDICRIKRVSLEQTPGKTHVACHRWRDLYS